MFQENTTNENANLLNLYKPFSTSNIHAFTYLVKF
jgi:hypothetical protein